MKYKIGDRVLIKAKVEAIEITKEGIVYCVNANDRKKGRFSEDMILADESILAPNFQQEQTQEPTGG